MPTGTARTRTTHTATTATAAATTTENAAERARRLWDGSFAGTAQALMAELGLTDEAIAVLKPWITDRVRATIRNDARDIEDAVWPERTSPPRQATEVRTQTGPLPALTDLERLLSLPVLVPLAHDGNQLVAWKDMTVTDHEARIGLLERPLNGIQTTISRHRWSIGIIQKYKVRTLGDIPVDVLRSDF